MDFLFKDDHSSTRGKANKENTKTKKSSDHENFILKVERAPMRAIPLNVCKQTFVSV